MKSDGHRWIFLPLVLLLVWCVARRPPEERWRTALTQQVGFVQPTSWEDEKVGRLCFVNPRTTIEHVRAILDLAA